MEIKCWGSRGSIPVSGKAYVEHGGDTTCLEIRTRSDDLIIVDAGTGIRRLGNQLIRGDRTDIHILFTHAHWDHVMGFPFFKPIYMGRFSIRMYRCPFPGYVEKMLGQVMKSPFFPVRYDSLPARISYAENCGDWFQIGSVTIHPIHLSHPNTGFGFKFVEDGRTFVFITDNELFHHHPKGLTYDDYAAFAQGADLLIHDGEYTEAEYERYRTFGHSTYRHALDLALDAEVGQLGLFHLNQDRSDREMRGIVKECRRIIRRRKRRMDCVAVKADMVFRL